jgi:hypothetical protein
MCKRGPVLGDVVIRCEVDGVRARTAPVTDRVMHAAAEALGQHYFGPNFDESHFDTWAASVDELLFVAEDAATGAFLGYADQMFLAPQVDAALRAGTISEEDFGPDAVLTDDALRRMLPGARVTLYLAGMCVVAPGTPRCRAAARALRACRRSLLTAWRTQGLQITMLLAAATPVGRRIAERAGGTLIGAAAARVDGYDLFELSDLPGD